LILALGESLSGSLALSSTVLAQRLKECPKSNLRYGAKQRHDSLQAVTKAGIIIKIFQSVGSSLLLM
jgi:hypothetical protein